MSFAISVPATPGRSASASELFDADARPSSTRRFLDDHNHHMIMAYVEDDIGRVRQRCRDDASRQGHRDVPVRVGSRRALSAAGIRHRARRSVGGARARRGRATGCGCSPTPTTKLRSGPTPDPGPPSVPTSVMLSWTFSDATRDRRVTGEPDHVTTGNLDTRDGRRASRPHGVARGDSAAPVPVRARARLEGHGCARRPLRTRRAGRSGRNGPRGTEGWFTGP